MPSFRAFLARPAAAYFAQTMRRQTEIAVAGQHRLLQQLVAQAAHTTFGKEHGFAQVRNYADFKKQVPLRDYEGFKPYIEQIKQGKRDVLWRGKPIYFAKTSGTTSGTKYIPISRDSIGNHFGTARNALIWYAHQSGNYDFFGGKMIFLSGSPVLDRVGGIPTGRLSGIVNHHIPAWLRTQQLPSYNTNCIEDWEEKVEAIARETMQQDMRLIGGIAPWMQMYFDRLSAMTHKTIGELFPNFSVLVQGGVNFEPYRAKLLASIGRPIDVVETYPASEGFIAFQYSPTEKGLWLNTDSGLFYEFVPVSEILSTNPTRLSLEEIELDTNYAIIVSSNAGLWSYNLGDTIKFISKNPYLLLVTGRVKHYISAFGEHVIGEEVEKAIAQVAHQYGVQINEFTVAPRIQPTDSKALPHHEWLVAFDTLPVDLPAFELALDDAMQQANIYYADLIRGKVLQPLRIVPLPADAFQRYMKSIGKLGGQNKVPHLSNDPHIADTLLALHRGLE